MYIIAKKIQGYLYVEIEGYYIEEFINLCLKNKIKIWNIKKENQTKIYLNIAKKDFKKIRKICRKTNCRVKIKRKNGFPFIFYKYKKRKIFMLFLLLIAIMIYISSKYIWNIQIDIENNDNLENIEKDLEDLGLKRGRLKKDIEVNQIIREIQLKRDDISWMGIEILGTNAIVKIVKMEEEPKIIDSSEHCNIVASKAGVITKIIAQDGTALVKPGDFVQKGDILIAGYIEGKYTEPRYVHSLRRSPS